jgi:DNA mismatch repair protein MSH5
MVNHFSLNLVVCFLLTNPSCAALNGVPETIVQRADEFVLMNTRGEDLVAACSVMPDSEVAELEEAVSCNSTFEQLESPLMPSQEQIARDFLEMDVLDDPRSMLNDILGTSAITYAHD